MRKDAAARRDKVIEVAATLFERDGYDIPLEAVVIAAGVGRGTLYRNFPDRAALMSAVLTYKLTLMERFVADHGDDATLLGAFLGHQGLVASLHAPAVAQLLADPSQRVTLQSLTNRTLILLEQIVVRCHAAGTLRRDVNASHLHMVTRMLTVSGMWPQADAHGGLHMAVDIITRGLAPV